ncbi:MAG: GDSL-type esterase/lipase family protein, partial [Verrucomicrobiota bacterium]
MKLFATICLLLAWAHAQAEPIRIVLVGDSLLSSSVHHEVTGKYGWGEFLGDFFSGEVEVINRGKGGQSTKSFIEAGFWEQALAFQGDYYFIEFGHNDQKESVDWLFTEPEGEYSENLRKFVFEILLQGGKPIFVTPL